MSESTVGNHGVPNGKNLKSGSFERILDFGPRFGRLFAHLPAHNPGPSASGQPDQTLGELGEMGGPMQETDKSPKVNSTIPAGFTFVGQFIDHDITLDTTSKLGSKSNPDSLRNFRTPALDLDCLYGSGPDATPHLYETGTGARAGMLYDPCNNDLPRALNRSGSKPGSALIGDPRNDENIFVSQLQLSMLKFHNKVLMEKACQKLPEEERFEAARKIVTFYYHRMILDDFLPMIIGEELTEDIKRNGPVYYQPFRHGLIMPVEFSVAAYRYGHSQLRANYTIAEKISGDLFTLGGFQVPEHKDWEGIEWRYLFNNIKGRKAKLQPAHKIDTKIPAVLMKLPNRVVKSAEKFRKSLASRNLQRGWTVGLPSGQAIATRMYRDNLIWESDIISHATIASDHPKTLGNMQETPLWYYVLKEAATIGKGNRLGPVGGRIVGEVLFGLMTGHREDVATGFQPDVQIHDKCKVDPCGMDGDPVTMADILNYTGYGLKK